METEKNGDNGDEPKWEVRRLYRLSPSRKKLRKSTITIHLQVINESFLFGYLAGKKWVWRWDWVGMTTTQMSACGVPSIDSSDWSVVVAPSVRGHVFAIIAINHGASTTEISTHHTPCGDWAYYTAIPLSPSNSLNSFEKDIYIELESKFEAPVGRWQDSGLLVKSRTEWVSWTVPLSSVNHQSTGHLTTILWLPHIYICIYISLTIYTYIIINTIFSFLPHYNLKKKKKKKKRKRKKRKREKRGRWKGMKMKGEEEEEDSLTMLVIC